MTSWPLLLRIARVPYAITILIGVGLIAPDQTRDMMGAVTDSRDITVLMASIAFFAFTAWFWARATVAAHFRLFKGKHWRKTIKELLGEAYQPGADRPIRYVAHGPIYLCILIALVLWYRTQSTVVLVTTLAVLLPLLLFVVFRREHFWTAWVMPASLLIGMSWAHWWGSAEIGWGAVYACTAAGLAFVALAYLLRLWISKTCPAAPGNRLQELLVSAPFGRGLAKTLLGISLAAFSISLVASLFPPSTCPPSSESCNVSFDRAWTFFLGVSPVLIGAALIIGPLTALVYWFDGWDRRVPFLGGGVRLSFPTLSILLAISLAVPYWVELHKVRVLPAPAPHRPTLRKHWDAWKTACGGAQPVIVAISGGASRAGLWGAAVLATVDETIRDRGAAIYAISSVSGGSLGAAAYLSARAGQNGPASGCWLPADRDAKFETYALDVGKADAIGPLLAGYVFNDVPRSIFGWLAPDRRGGDRAAAIERAFEYNAREAARESGLGSAVVGFEKPFTALAAKPATPLWIANGTERDTGSRILTIAVKGNLRTGIDWPFEGASDLIGHLCRDVPISTAINNTARFPFLEPEGLVRSPDASCWTYNQKLPAAVIDGGYFDNSGLESALELAAWIRNASPGVEPIVIAATGDGESTTPWNELIDCSGYVMDPLRPRSQKHVLEPVGPVFGLYNVRAGHVDVLRRRAAAELCPGSQKRFFHFFLPGQGKQNLPLNWVLSDNIARFIWCAASGRRAMEVPPKEVEKQVGEKPDEYLVRNQRELAALAGAMQQGQPKLLPDQRDPARCAAIATRAS